MCQSWLGYLSYCHYSSWLLLLFFDAFLIAAASTYLLASFCDGLSRHWCGEWSLGVWSLFPWTGWKQWWRSIAKLRVNCLVRMYNVVDILLTLILQRIARKYSNIAQMKQVILGWSKHVGYTVLGYQPENVGKTCQRFDRDAPIFFRVKISRNGNVPFLWPYITWFTTNCVTFMANIFCSNCMQNTLTNAILLWNRLLNQYWTQVQMFSKLD